ncbi:flagellar motor stator protein MotA [Bacillus sp. B190/17]|uniref:Flagellar motor stator protein MotA n=1 Tax=Bacillus lumedeiriae TaxID=3058829 RepID=A0ABW8IBX6_9BACI
MDKSSIIGVILGVVAVGVGMVFKGVSPEVLINPAALLIILLGTAATVTIAFPSSELKRLPKLFGVIFKEKEMMSPQEVIRQFTGWAELARREGLLALEARVDEVDEPFLKNGLSLAVDGQNADYIRDVMNEELSAMEERHASAASMFVQAGTYAPTLGVLGAVIGLIAALGNMNDTDTLGHAISAAFVATLLGIFTGYVLWHPFANKLKRKSRQEIKVKEMMIEGVLSILEGESPRVLEQKLSSYLPADEKKKLIEESGETNE